MDKPTSANTDLEIEAVKKYVDPRLAEKLERRRYGDGLDRIGLREGMDGVFGVALLAGAVGMYVFGELVFAWQSGSTFLPGLKAGDIHFGGVVSVANSILFLVLVFAYIHDGRPAFGRKERRNQVTGEIIEPAMPGNRWSTGVVATGFLALFAIFVAQTTAADEVRKAVARQETLQAKIETLDREIKETRDTMPSRKTATLALERAQDEAVGSKLATLTAGEAKILCANVADFEAAMQCRQAALRASVDCTQSVSTLVRDSACDPIKMAEIQLARIDELEALQAKRQTEREEAEAELKVLPEVSNQFVRDISHAAGWSIPDAQSRVYIFIALICLIIPALIFAKVLVRRPDPPKRPAAAATNHPQGG